MTIASLFFVTRLGLSKDLTTLFPHTPEADMLARVTRAFGGGDLGLVLVRGDEPDAALAATEALAKELGGCASIAAVHTSVPAAPAATDPTEAWRFAGPRARERLAHALTPDGMAERLHELRALVLAPGAGDLADLVTKDPLRLSLIPWEDRVELAAGVTGEAGGAFVSKDRRARLIVLEPRGRAFDPDAAARFTDDVDAAVARVARPGVSVDVAGGHVVARQTEAMIRSDLERSGALSFVLSSVVFAVAFPRRRALVAVLPPLALGTLWTTALAALLYPQLSAVATGFTAVVIGVGVDTGVHVYGRLLVAVREGEPNPAVVARRETWRPTLGAAVAAGGAFGCLLLSEIEGMRQLGLLCAAGEVLTALAILALVPELGALLERRAAASPRRESQPRGGFGIGRWVVALTATRARAVAVLAVVAVGGVAAVALGLPRVETGIATLDARTLPALAAYDAIYSQFGGTRGQVMVVSADPDPARARARADAVAEAADRLLGRGAIAGYDALATVAPSPEMQRYRLAERDRLELPARGDALTLGLEKEGFSVVEFRSALDALEHPSTRVTDDAPEWIRRRHLATDAEGTLAVTFVRFAPGKDSSEARAVLRAADPAAVITGFGELEAGLARSLAKDLPKVLAGAALIVIFALGASLRRPARVALAAGVLAVEIALVLVLARAFGVRWHVYDALVLPVLLGITLDEVLFLLEADERSGSIEAAVVEQAPLATATALTTAAGFAALTVCKFPGLVDVGMVGALGSSVGLFVAIVAIPAFFRLTR
ncbi:MAG: MMPL family transporter [Labilithrix sp.]|nr:MMPL family transporter [Labilithrix sp.]